jgi:hypothetical protein
MAGDAANIQTLLPRAVAGDQQARDELFACHRDRLWRMVRLRLDRRLHGRVDAAGVVEEARADIFRRLGEYVANPRQPPAPDRRDKCHRTHVTTVPAGMNNGRRRNDEFHVKNMSGKKRGRDDGSVFYRH